VRAVVQGGARGNARGRGMPARVGGAMRDVGLSANRRCDRGVLRVETVVNGRRQEFFSELTFSRVVHAEFT